MSGGEILKWTLYYLMRPQETSNPTDPCKSLAKGELYIQANKYLFEISTVSYKQKSIHT